VVLEFATEGKPATIDPEIEALLLRVMQEALTNIVKHSAARTVRLTLAYEPRRVRLSISDDGRGFVVHPDLHSYEGHWGLLGMRERATQLRGTLSVQSTPGVGTEIVLLVPSSSSRKPGRTDNPSPAPGSEVLS
jgi:signal transduction histidine kinase